MTTMRALYPRGRREKNIELRNKRGKNCELKRFGIHYSLEHFFDLAILNVLHKYEWTSSFNNGFQRQ